MYIKYFLILIIFFPFIADSSCKKNIVTDIFFYDKIYKFAQQKLLNGNYQSAIQNLERLDRCYPFGPYGQQIQLNLIFAYYKSAKLSLAQTFIDRFIRFNPAHPNLDYVFYMRGLTNMALDDSAVLLQQYLFGVDRSEFNPEHARAAFHDFVQLIRFYPNSQYSMDANRRLVYLKHRLAKYELSVVKYYNRRDAYVAVVNRVDHMLRNFSDTQEILLALPYMEKAYRKLQLIDLANKVSKIIEVNHL